MPNFLEYLQDYLQNGDQNDIHENPPPVISQSGNFSRNSERLPADKHQGIFQTNVNNQHQLSQNYDNNETQFASSEERNGAYRLLGADFKASNDGAYSGIHDELTSYGDTGSCPPGPPQSLYYLRSNSYEDYQNVKSRKHGSNIPVDFLSSLPNRIRGIFPFSSFNRMQTEAFQDIFNTPYNCVITSPTGSGKTVLFELGIIRLFLKNNKIDLNNNMKVLYIAPTKALCTERCEDWKKKFAPLNISVGMLTSDTSSFETESVKKSNIIISTPEKWDLLTRRWFDFIKLFDLVKLLLIDEVHILKDDRGSTLEVVTTRMKRLCDQLRIIALSATVPNINDISKWLRKTSKGSSEPAVTMIFGEEYKPVKLLRTVYGFRNHGKNDFQFDFSLNNRLLEIIREKSLGKPVLIFCPTRKIAFNTATFLSNNLGFELHKLKDLIKVQDKEISKLISKGVAFHHAGISYKDRLAVENNFINGNIKILCSTSTLAVGVNLPAYLVIIKGTRYWNEGQFSEYSELDILQMIGRAGRPQFETEGVAVIMTEEKNKNRYERLIEGTEKLESSLHLNLFENLAAEVCLKTITTVETAVDWIASTYFYTRYKSNPIAYSEIQGLRVIDIDTRLALFCQKQLEILRENQILDYDKFTRTYKSTAYGNAMSHHYVSFETMKKIINSPSKLNFSSVFDLLCQATEFKDLKIKHMEKKLYKEIASSNLLKFPPPKILGSSYPQTYKISLLLQYELGGLEFPNYKGSFGLYFNFNGEKLYLLKQCPRLIKCMADAFTEKKDSISLLNILKLGRSVCGKCWEDSGMMLKQLDGIGLKYVRKFINHNIMNFEQVSQLDASKIEYYLGLKPGHGNKILKDVASIPKFSISCRLVSHEISKDLDYITISFNVNVQCLQGVKVTHWHKQFVMVNIVTEISDGELVDFRRIMCGKLESPKVFSITAKIRKKNQIIRSHIACDVIANTKTWAALKLNIPSRVFDELIVSVPEVEEPVLTDPFSDDDDDDDDDEFDDSIFSAAFDNYNGIEKQEILISTDIDSRADETPISTQVGEYKRRSDGNYECKHTCKNKDKCRHLCCHEGLLHIPRKRAGSKELKGNKIQQRSPKSSNKTVEIGVKGINFQQRGDYLEKSVRYTSKNLQYHHRSSHDTLGNLYAEKDISFGNLGKGNTFNNGKDEINVSNDADSNLVPKRKKRKLGKVHVRRSELLDDSIDSEDEHFPSLSSYIEKKQISDRLILPWEMELPKSQAMESFHLNIDEQKQSSKMKEVPKQDLDDKEEVNIFNYGRFEKISEDNESNYSSDLWSEDDRDENRGNKPSDGAKSPYEVESSDFPKTYAQIEEKSSLDVLSNSFVNVVHDEEDINQNTLCISKSQSAGSFVNSVLIANKRDCSGRIKEECDFEVTDLLDVLGSDVEFA